MNTKVVLSVFLMFSIVFVSRIIGCAGEEEPTALVDADPTSLESESKRFAYCLMLLPCIKKENQKDHVNNKCPLLAKNNANNKPFDVDLIPADVQKEERYQCFVKAVEAYINSVSQIPYKDAKRTEPKNAKESEAIRAKAKADFQAAKCSDVVVNSYKCETDSNLPQDGTVKPSTT